MVPLQTEVGTAVAPLQTEGRGAVAAEKPSVVPTEPQPPPVLTMDSWQR